MRATRRRSAAIIVVTGIAAAACAGSVQGTSEPVPGGEIGLIDGVYVGAGGFQIDPADCPSDWDASQGITDDEIVLFRSGPESGPLALYSLFPEGARAYFDYVNDNGGIDGRKIVLVSQDDGYTPDRTISNVDEALGSGDYAAFFNIFGTASFFAVRDQVNDECMPMLLTSTGSPAAGDIVEYPWTTGNGLDYVTEPGLWVEWLVNSRPELTKVAQLAFNNDFGRSYTAGFENAVVGTDIEIVATEYHDAASPNLTNQVTTLAASGAEVVVVETAGVFCAQALGEIEKRTEWDPVVIISGVCATLDGTFVPLLEQGLTGADAYVIKSWKDPLEAALADDEFVRLYYEVLESQGLDPTQGVYWEGWMFGWPMVEVLRAAATYEGGLDRGNIMLAAWNLQVDNPTLINGLTSRTNGLEDAYFTEGGQMNRYSVSDPTELGTWVPEGDIVNREGVLGNFSNVQEMMGN